MMALPIDDNEGRGIGANVVTNKGMKIYEIASPYVQFTHEKQFGFDNEFMARFLTIHEFGHSFVNNEVYKYSDRINKTDSLFDKSLLKDAKLWNTQLGNLHYSKLSQGRRNLRSFISERCKACQMIKRILFEKQFYFHSPIGRKISYL